MVGHHAESCHVDSRSFFLCGMRFYFGVWFLYVGLMKWFDLGAEAFVGHIVNEFDKTWSPHILNVTLAWVIIIAEPVLALLILSGKRARAVWSLTSLFLFMLTFGQTILKKPDVNSNWQYVVLTLVCAALSAPDHRLSCSRSADAKAV